MSMDLPCIFASLCLPSFARSILSLFLGRQLPAPEPEVAAFFDVFVSSYYGASWGKVSGYLAGCHYGASRNTAR